MVRLWSGHFEHKQDMSIRQLLLYAACLTNFGLAAQPIALAEPGKSSTLTLAQTLEAAKLNWIAKFSEQELAAARSDVLTANRAPLPIFSAKASATDASNGTTLATGSAGRKTDKAWGLDWTLERGGKRAYRTEAAQLISQAAEAELTETQLQQQLLAKDLFFDALTAQEKSQHLKAIAIAAETTASTAKVRHQAGDLSAQDMMRIEIESERAAADYRKSLLEEKRVSQALAQILGIATMQSITVKSDWPTLSSLPLEQSQSLESWIASRPDVKAAILRMQASQVLLENAKALGKIDPTIGLSVDSNPGTTKRLTELRVQFPLQGNSTYDGEIGRATAQLYQTQTQLEQSKLNAENEWKTMREAHAASIARQKIYTQEIVPRAQKVAAQAEMAYAKGAIPLVDLLDARRTLKNSLIEALDVQAEHAKTSIALQIRAPKL